MGEKNEQTNKQREEKQKFKEKNKNLGKRPPPPPPPPPSPWVSRSSRSPLPPGKLQPKEELRQVSANA